jgi:hypothetical protein
MTIIVKRECWFCGSTYGFMTSGYGVDPSIWNEAKGVGYHYCSECADKVTPLHEEMWKLQDDVERNLQRMESLLNDPDSWFAWWRATRQFPIRRIHSELIKMDGKIDIQPMSRPVGSVFFLEMEKKDGF